MQYTREQRLEKSDMLSPELSILYESPKSGELLMEVFARYALPEKDYKAFAITIGEIILGFYAKSQLSELLHRNIGVPEMIAGKISEDLTDFLSIVPDVVAPPLEASPAVAVAAIPGNPITQTVSTTMQTPPPLYKKENVVGARTMQSDIASIKKEEDRKPFIADRDKTPNASSAPVPPPQVTPPPLVRGVVPGEDAVAPDSIPRYSKPLTDLPRYNNLK